MALCFGAGLSLLLQRKYVNMAAVLLCVVALAYIMTHTKEIQNVQTRSMQYATHINTPFEMDVVEQDKENTKKTEDHWQEWNNKYAENTHIQRWLGLFGTRNEFDGFHLI